MKLLILFLLIPLFSISQSVVIMSNVPSSVYMLKADTSAYYLKTTSDSRFVRTKLPYSSGNKFFQVVINKTFANITDSANSLQDGNSSFTDNCVCRLPSTYTATGTPTRLIMWAHGAGGGVTTNYWYVGATTGIVDSLVAAGYAVFDCQGERVENMGGSWAIQSYFKAYKYMIDNYNLYERIHVGGASMGGLTSSNFVLKHSNIVLSHFMLVPVTDLKLQAWDHPWGATNKENTAIVYNFVDQSGGTWEPTKVTGWNPIDFTDNFYPVPVKIWHGNNDATVNISGSRTFISNIKAWGGYGDLRTINGAGHNDNLSGYALNEFIYWIKRFE